MSETTSVSTRMKHRWIGGLIVAAALALGACAPPNQGGQSSEEPSQAPASSAPATTAEPTDMAEPSESEAAETEDAEPTPYEY
jgi:hypothetical protein